MGYRNPRPYAYKLSDYPGAGLLYASDDADAKHLAQLTHGYNPQRILHRVPAQDWKG